MKVYPGFETSDTGRPMLWVKARAESDDGTTIGDGGFEVRPGQTRAGLPYAEWETLARENRAVEVGDDLQVVRAGAR